jgi:hypothetical protein
MFRDITLELSEGCIGQTNGLYVLTATQAEYKTYFKSVEQDEEFG